MLTRTIIALFVVIGLTWPLRAQVVKDTDQDLQQINVNEHLGNYIPLDLTFTDDHGQEVSLGKYFNQGKPVVLTLGYYECPMLCNLVFNGLADAVKKLDWIPGKDFQMITVSINPKEKPELAYAKKTNYVAALGKPVPESGWVFMTGKEDQIKKLADAVGFQYFYDAEHDQYGHPAVVMLLGEDGKITRYLYGVDYKGQDMRLALLEASNGKIGNTIDRILLYCCQYDPNSKGYAIVAGNVMRLSGVVVVLVLGTFLTLMWRGERKKRRLAEQAEHASSAPAEKVGRG